MKKVFLGWPQEAFDNYVNALTALGAAVEREDPDGCDALVLPGGEDVHPGFYGQDVDGARGADEARDICELALFWRFFDAGRPILGICRGEQLINVALGGTLRQHIDGHGKHADGSDGTHEARSDDPMLRALYGERFTVNSAHHQATERLGRGLRAVARAADGTVEAIRHDSRPVLGVQWHPERFGDAGAALLQAFFKSL